MTKRVSQRFTADCTVACLAMFLGVGYEAVIKHCSGYELVFGGLTNNRERYLAKLFEIEIVFKDVSKLERGGPAVLTVPSLNSDRGATHAVYWDGKRLFDPNRGRRGKLAYGADEAWAVAIDGYQAA